MLVKTTLNVPKDLLEEAKMYALVNKTSLSKMFTEHLQKQFHSHEIVRDDLSWEEVLGTVKGKYKKSYEKRGDLYDDD